MTRSKKIEPAVQVASAVQNTMTILASKIATLGGNLTEAFVRLGMGERQYTAELDQIAGVLAKVSAVPVAEIVAPEGGRLHTVCIPVDESVNWNTAVSAGFPNTPSNYDVWKVGDQYPPRPRVVSVKREIILINFGKEISNADIAFAWGKEHKLISASPRSIWALGKHKPQLNTELEQNVLAVASLEECAFSGDRRVPCGWWGGGERRAFLDLPDHRWYDHCWFAFVRE